MKREVDRFSFSALSHCFLSEAAPHATRMGDPPPAVAHLAAAAATATSAGARKGAVAGRLAAHFAHAVGAPPPPAEEGPHASASSTPARVIARVREQAAALTLLSKGLTLPPALAEAAGGMGQVREHESTRAIGEGGGGGGEGAGCRGLEKKKRASSPPLASGGRTHLSAPAWTLP